MNNKQKTIRKKVNVIKCVDNIVLSSLSFQILLAKALKRL